MLVYVTCIMITDQLLLHIYLDLLGLTQLSCVQLGFKADLDLGC